MTETSWAVRVFGTPAPKGSMKCVGGRGRHQLVNNNPATKPWQEQVATAAKRLVEHHALAGPLSGPLGADITITVDRPASVKPTARRWPWKTSRGMGGDVDKLARTVLDGLQDGGLLADDAQVCDLHAVKAYPDTEEVPGRMERPGALIRVYRL